MRKCDQLVIQLIQVALGCRSELSLVPASSQWTEVYEIAIRQAVVGICFAGVKKLFKEQQPPEELLYEWLGDVVTIEQQNHNIDKQTAAIWEQLEKDGLHSVILKGQGIAQDYGELASLRQPGDIDIWVKGGYKTVCDYVLRTYPTDDLAYHRFHYDYFKDMEVELHHRPTLMRNLFDNRKLARWYESFDPESFVYLEKKGFAVPPASFNVIFILTHIYRHFLFEGIGLKQVMDYYFVLKNGHTENTGILSPAEKDEIKGTLKALRLTRFAEAMMWILHSQMGLEEQYLICGMNEKEGRFVLDEILQTGNFGQGDRRYRYKRWYKLRHHISHGSHLLMHYPSEVIWTPIWLVYHRWWKWNKRRKMA